jgi:IS605 OrfB family transposase
MKKKLRSIENKIDNLLHNISSEIVSLAKERKSVIVMENLQGLRQHGRKKNRGMKRLNYFLSLFDYGKIAQLINYKAKMAGVPMYDINPFGTSQNCAKCLLNEVKGKYLRDQKNSKIGRCNECGQVDADLNAARTIAVCYHQERNDPQPFGERMVFKRF